MVRILIATAALALFVTALVGCRAEGDIDTQSLISMAQ